MTQDKALLPKQVLRLCALGKLLQSGPMSYPDLAQSVTEFTAHLIGPTLDMMGSSLELLRYDGLIEPAEGERLAITDAGEAEFRDLMAAQLPTPASELSKLVVALKIRFLHLLDPQRRQDELSALVGLYQQEIARLEDLRERQADEPGNLDCWLEHDIAQNRSRLAWLRALQTGP